MEPIAHVDNTIIAERCDALMSKLVIDRDAHVLKLKQLQQESIEAEDVEYLRAKVLSMNADFEAELKATLDKLNANGPFFHVFAVIHSTWLGNEISHSIVDGKVTCSRAMKSRESRMTCGYFLNEADARVFGIKLCNDEESHCHLNHTIRVYVEKIDEIGFRNECGGRLFNPSIGRTQDKYHALIADEPTY